MNAEWMDRFRAQVEEAGGKVVMCRSREEAVGWVEQELRRRDVKEALVGRLGEEWERSLRETLVSCRVGLVQTLPTIPPDGIPEVGIGEADYAIAETGTLVEIAQGRDRHLTSLLPSVHIALLAYDRILPDLEACLDVLSPLLREQPRPRVIFITGPSRSADIEKLLILGAHGPRELVVIVYPP